MPKKAQRMSAREFSDRFTEIVSRHFATLPPKEQDKRAKNAERAARGISRAEPSSIPYSRITARKVLFSQLRSASHLPHGW